MSTPVLSIRTVRDLETYELALQLQQRVFEFSKHWPREEAYSLTDQIRRSSRSIGANLSEGWAKRKYPAHFLSKLTDADGELQETQHWILTATACGYLEPDAAAEVEREYAELGRKLGMMIVKHETFCLR